MQRRSGSPTTALRDCRSKGGVTRDACSPSAAGAARSAVRALALGRNRPYAARRSVRGMIVLGAMLGADVIKALGQVGATLIGAVGFIYGLGGVVEWVRLTVAGRQSLAIVAGLP